MRVLLIVLILSALAMSPFLFLRRPWALRMAHRIRLLFLLYDIVIIVSAVVSLVFRWDEVYG